MKSTKTWKDWWKRVYTGIPLCGAPLIGLLAYGVWAFIILIILVWYISGILDREWYNEDKR